MQPQPAPAPYDPYNQPHNQPQQPPQPYDPNAYDPYTDPRQPPPTPPPGYDPYNRSPQQPPQPYYPPGPQQPPPQPQWNPQQPPPQPQWNPQQPPPPQWNPQQPPPPPQWNPQQPPSQPQWNAPTPSQAPPPITRNPTPSPSTGTSPTPTPTPSPAATPTPPPDQRQRNIDLVTPPANAVPTPYNPPAPQECVSYGGSTYGGGTKAATVSWPPMPEAYVPLLAITNGCGPGGPSVDPAQYYDLDVSVYLDSYYPELTWGTDRYTVNFRKACLMHDVGYSGAKSFDLYSNSVRDFFDDTRQTVDDRFYTDMVKECDAQIPAKAKDARENCKAYGGHHASHGAKTRYQGVVNGGKAVGAWKDRPNLNGTWRISGFGNAGTWSITQNKRSVIAKWNGGTAAPDYSGEFRGTLISHDAWHTVEGYYVVYDKGVPRCSAPVPSSWRWEPGNRDKLTINGPGSLTLVK